MNVVLAVVAAILLAFSAVQLSDSWGGGYWLFGCAAGAVVCTIALLRRRQRVVAAGAGLLCAAIAVLVAWLAALPAEPSPAMALGLAVLVGSVVRTVKPIPATVVAGAGFVVALGGLVFQRSDLIPPVLSWNLFGWSAAVVIGYGLRFGRSRRQEIADRIRRDERLELARELHDVVAHHITGVVLQTQAARIIRRKNPAELDDSLAGIEAASSEALVAMRRVVGLLRDADDAVPAAPGLDQVRALAERMPGKAVRVDVPDGADWPPEMMRTVYRVVRESLTNIGRHASTATSVTVAITDDGRSVSVEVTDDGKPHRGGHRGGYGLVGIRERVEALDGVLSVGPRAEGGWSVRATLPLIAGKPR
ncbi:sensor histidine kinase [Fodinicola acaciae]|uniref:sensor histidine kinase n=1 Tax=Fodinicola acaciae TaxID=2681555 RepID=UPI001C9E8112|nr:histidine kinase [Fodinicola acaciae]